MLHSLTWPARASGVRRRTLQARALILMALWMLNGWASADSRVISENATYRVITAGPEDSFEALAARYLGGAEHAWRIAELNPQAQAASPGLSVRNRVLVVPKGWANPTGIRPGRYPVVPILTYHRFGPRPSQLMVTPEDFRAQIRYLRDNNYQVVSLKQFAQYLDGEAGLPPRAVVLTIDDGYQSTFKLALPILQEFAMQATVFVYTDFINRGGLKQKQMQQMLETGLIDLQSHSKSHANLSLRLEDEDVRAYGQRLQNEIALPKQKIEQLLGRPVYAFAYPYGATNSRVVGQLQRAGYDMALTVKRGANRFYSHPLLLRRSMVFGGYDLERFAKLLQTETTY